MSFNIIATEPFERKLKRLAKKYKIVYAHTDLEPQKQKTAQKLITEHQKVISTQVLQETANTLVKKFKHSWLNVSKVAAEAIQNNLLHINYRCYHIRSHSHCRTL